MSLKAIEMQVALPRTLDAQKLQEQMQQRGQLQTDFATDNVKKEDIKKEQTVLKQEQKDIARFQKERNQDQHSGEHGEKKEKHHQKKEKHPYKGTHVDFSG
ncbi:hypothetical protein [Robertmurraya kyonggiensis]|uniref:RNA polymerase subunit sigma n=1 Tax=Robertmurraya kyonggiensis TaxID=1037680 RepID=A0A4U1D862_9BACI|nr:hypothetical protein [Robertmurraya kyonggiensis]TKC18681.1 hypothetical protein FA727_03770 [Robertmurraya kyonggiensis]